MSDTKEFDFVKVPRENTSMVDKIDSVSFCPPKTFRETKVDNNVIYPPVVPSQPVIPPPTCVRIPKAIPKTKNQSPSTAPDENFIITTKKQNYKYGIHYEHVLKIIDMRNTVNHGDMGIWTCYQCSCRGIGPVLGCLKCGRAYCSVCLLKSAVGEVNL